MTVLARNPEVLTRVTEKKKGRSRHEAEETDDESSAESDQGEA
jgi:hypothetical protein